MLRPVLLQHLAAAHRSIQRGSLRRLGFSAALGVILATTAAARIEWPVVPAAELAETKPQIEPDAAAEVIEWKYEVDDRDFPESRTTTEYVRFKIFAPDKAQQVTRVSGIDNANTEKLDVRARLTLPNGRVQEFGPEAVKERTLAREARAAGLLGWLTSSAESVKEKFLAVPGIEAGAVLEYRIVRIQNWPAMYSVTPIQRAGIPIRQVEYLCHTCSAHSGWISRTFVLNKMTGQAHGDDKKREFVFTATNVPSLVREPFIGPISDYAMTILTGFESVDKLLISRSGRVPAPGRVETKAAPWTLYATLMNWWERDRGYPTSRVKKLAAEITAGATDDKAKAIAIHRYVRSLYQQARHKPVPKNHRPAESLDEVLEFDKAPGVERPPREFLFLAVALYQSAGLDAHIIMLPDRQLCRFRPEYVSPALLPHEAIAIRLNGEYYFSAPHNKLPLPFGLLPWQEEGQSGLLALDHEQRFIPVPIVPSDDSLITVNGTFALDLAGTLTGNARRTFTGHAAGVVREALDKADPAHRRAAARPFFGLDPKIVSFAHIEIENLDQPDEPLTISGDIRWPGYAARTKERLLFRPAVFQADDKPPFTSAERLHPVSFPYRWREVDDLKISVPEGFEPEAPTAAPAADLRVLFHQVELAYDRKNRVLYVKRLFKTDAIEVPVKAYPTLKAWYEEVSSVDQRQVVFSGKDIPMPEMTEETAKTPSADEGDADKTESTDGDAVPQDQ